MENYTPRLKTRYREEVVPALVKRFGYDNVMQVPRLVKITVNKGVGEASANKKVLDDAVEEVRLITGQQPSVRRARKSISNFKIRDGMPVGVAVTLRGDRMWEFVDRLITLALPRVRDFRGVPDRSFDGRGNYTLGVKEQIIFPEIDIDKIDRVSGLDVTIVTTAPTDEEAYALLKELGMPFVRREQDEPVAA
jgi:large subunit ribosomal protein L5